MDKDAATIVRVAQQVTPRARFWAGLSTLSPIVIGVLPFAMIAGIASIEAGLSPLEGQGMSLIVFAGASQLAGLQLMGTGAAPVVTILTVWIINLRFMLYSASLGPHFKDLSTAWKALLAHIMTDQAYAVTRCTRPSSVQNCRPHTTSKEQLIGFWYTQSEVTDVVHPVQDEIPEMTACRSMAVAQFYCSTFVRTPRLQSKADRWSSYSSICGRHTEQNGIH